jgi:hypothetical protein
MILPLIVGIAAGRYVRKRIYSFILGVSVGVVFGVLSGLAIAPLLYPLMIIHIPWIGVPEIRRLGLAFGHPDIILFAESVHFQSFSLIMLSSLLAVSIVGAVIGIYLGIRLRRPDINTPWETTEDED